MFYRVSGLRMSPDKPQTELNRKAAKELGISADRIRKIKLYRSSLDARGGKVSYLYTVDVFVVDGTRVRPGQKCKRIEREYHYFIPSCEKPKNRPLVIGFGPSGMFAALVLARAGLNPIVVERGKSIDEREKDVSVFFSGGSLNSESNVQFGEGGAGTFSDGKLNTLLKDRNERGRFVLEEFVKAGAPEEILWKNKPHIGTDRLRVAVRGIREEIKRLGGTVFFESRFVSAVMEQGKVVGARILFPDGERVLNCDCIFLGIGHSARDTFWDLRSQGIAMEKKIFSVGVRIEHLQENINRAQYGAENAFHLPAADYKLAVPTSCGKRLYTFCMCPGGVVVPAASEEGGVVVNGMSDFSRDGINSNSALLVNVLPEELPEDLFSGFDYQRELEGKAYFVGGSDFSAPCQLVGDFLAGVKTTGFGAVKPSYARGVKMANLAEVLSPSVVTALKEGIVGMGKMLQGFDDEEAILTGVESRATCPVRILRGEDYQASVKGFYPIGEGAGYAGGIMSSAMDGMRAVEAYIKTLKETK